jgi:dienelactone hydrolase
MRIIEARLSEEQHATVRQFSSSREVAPERYAGLFSSAAPSLTFPHQRELEEIVRSLLFQPVETESSDRRVQFWVQHQQTVLRSAREPHLRYDVLVPEQYAEAPDSGWPLLVLAQTAALPYAAIAQDRLGIVVKPQFTWNTFEEDHQILDAAIADIGVDYPVDDHRLVLHGCSVGGQFAFEYTLAEPNRVMGAVVMAAPSLEVPPQAAWHIPFVFFYGDLDPFYDSHTRAVIESMQRKMDSVELFLDAGQAHVCDPALAIEAIQALLVE